MYLARVPSRLLMARHQVVPFMARPELEPLQEWRDSAPGLLVRLVYAEGGQGKTRLAAEFGVLAGADNHPGHPGRLQATSAAALTGGPRRLVPAAVNVLPSSQMGNSFLPRVAHASSKGACGFRSRAG